MIASLTTESASPPAVRPSPGLGSPASLAILALVFLLVAVPRFVELDRTITSDEGYWIQRTLRFGAALARGDLSSTFRSGHPGVTTMWVGLIGVGPQGLAPFTSPLYTNYQLLERHPNYLEVLHSARQAIVVAGAILTTLVVALTWRLLGPGPALTGGALISLDPYLVGSAQLLHVDTLLPPIVLAGLLSGLIFWLDGGQRRYLVLSGVLTGLAVLTKAPGIALPLFIGCLGLVVARPWKHGLRSLKPLVVMGGLALVLYFLLWPALWVDPARRIGQVIGFAIDVGGRPHAWSSFFLGRPTVGDPGPLFYPLALAFRISPAVIAGLILLALTYRRERDRRGAVLTLVGFVVFFFVLMTVGAKKFDRYLLPAIVVINLLAGVGLWWAVRRMASPLAGALTVAVFVVAQAGLFLAAQPYPLAAYNPLAGGMINASRVLMVGWGEGYEQVAEFLNAQPNAEQLVVKAHYHHVLRPRFVGTTVRLPEDVTVDYFVVYINTAQRRLTPSSLERIIAERPPDFTAVVNGSPYAWVYHVGEQVMPMPDQMLEGDEE